MLNFRLLNFQFILSVLGDKADASLRSGANQIPRNLSKGEQVKALMDHLEMMSHKFIIFVDPPHSGAKLSVLCKHFTST